MENFEALIKAQCDSCNRPIHEIVKFFLDPLVGTILLGIEKCLNNKHMEKYMSRKLNDTQKFQLRNGHKQKVFNPYGSKGKATSSQSKSTANWSNKTKDNEHIPNEDFDLEMETDE